MPLKGVRPAVAAGGRIDVAPLRGANREQELGVPLAPTGRPWRLQAARCFGFFVGASSLAKRRVHSRSNAQVARHQGRPRRIVRCAPESALRLASRRLIQQSPNHQPPLARNHQATRTNPPFIRPNAGVAQGDARQDAERGAAGQGCPVVTCPRSNAGVRAVWLRSRQTRMMGSPSLWLLSLGETRESDAPCKAQPVIRTEESVAFEVLDGGRSARHRLAAPYSTAPHSSAARKSAAVSAWRSHSGNAWKRARNSGGSSGGASRSSARPVSLSCSHCRRRS